MEKPSFYKDASVESISSSAGNGFVSITMSKMCRLDGGREMKTTVTVTEKYPSWKKQPNLEPVLQKAYEQVLEQENAVKEIW